MKPLIVFSSLGAAALFLTGCTTEVVSTRPGYAGDGYHQGSVVYQERGPYVDGVIYRDGRHYRGDRVVYYDNRDRRYYDYDRNHRDNDTRVNVINVRTPQVNRDRYDNDRRVDRDNDRPDTVVNVRARDNDPRQVTARQRVENREPRQVREEVKIKKTKKKTVEETVEDESAGQYQRKPRL